MNKTFKTIWNDVRRNYMVVNETQKSHGKPAKSAVALAVAATALFASAAGAAYVDPGFVAQNSSQVEQAKTSWETAEYLKNWGLVAQHASAAYALGYYGQGVKIGQMDSGILQGHQELTGDRWHVVSASGQYTHDGERYPQYAYPAPGKDTGEYHAGDKFDVDGYYNSEFNDNHGTGCAGVYAGNRDGVGMHGVAWGSDFYSANTGGTDDSNYGPFPDYGFFKAGYDALVDAGVKIINNSWGTNLKQVKPDGNIQDYYESGPVLTTVQDIEYEYFMFKKNYDGGPSFVDAAWDSVKGKDVIQAFSAGNNRRENPYHRGLYPYFNPEAENQWLVVSGLTQVDKNSDPYNYKIETNFNEAGYAKYWTLSAPGQNGNTSNISGGYGSYSGTSMATPFVSGAFAVLASRYTDMSAVQVRQVLLTTANHKNEDGSDMEGWANVDGTTPAEGEISDRMGWGVPDLEKGMYGLGQLFGHFDYNMATNKLDVWSNDISQAALDQREREDMEWLMSATDDGTVNGNIVISDNPADYKLTNDLDLAGIADKTVSLADAKKWRLEYYEKRIAAIKDKIDNGLYDGSLTKRGQGTLVMTGNNTYRGGTVVEEGTLLGFNDSFGVTGDDGSASANGKVTVNGGVFGVINKYNDQFTMKGELTDENSAHSVDVLVKEGGAYAVAAGQDVTVGNLTFEKGAGVTVVSTDSDVLVDAYNGNAATGSVTADSLVGADLVVAKPDYAFFDTEVAVDGNKLTATLSRSDATVATYAASASQAAIASALNGNTGSKVFGDIVGSTKDQVRTTLASLGSDFHMTAQNAAVVNAASTARMIKDQASAFGQARTAELANGAKVWAAGVGSWSNLDAGGASVDMDVDFYAGFFGGEVAYGDRNKVGAFFGAGTTEFDASADGKIESNDIHFGVYGESLWDKVGAVYGFAYTTQDRDSKRSLVFNDQVGFNAVNYDAEVMQVFGEVSCKALAGESYSVEPYVGLSYMRVSADGFDEAAGGHTFRTQLDDQNVGIFNLGVRGSVPFTVGSVSMTAKGDLGYMQFFGDKEATATMTVGDAGTASLKGEELSGMAAVGLGVEANVGKNTVFGVSYTGAFGSDVTSHGIGANVKFTF